MKWLSEMEKWLRIRVRFFINFWLRVRKETQNPAGVDSESGSTSDVYVTTTTAGINGLRNFSVRVQSRFDEIESDPVLIRKIFENHQSNPVLIRQCKIMYFDFASWGKRTTGAILPLAKYDWLKAK